MSNQSLKIAFVTPPIEGHLSRGVGKYSRYLFDAMNRLSEVDIKWVRVNDELTNFDLVHYPYFDPFFLTMPYFKKKPTIVTVHDLIPLLFSRHFPKGIKGFLKWLLQRLSLKNSNAIITDSQTSKTDICRFIRTAENKINVIYLGVGEDFTKIKSNNYLSQVRKTYLLPDKFLLYVGDVNYNKNIPNMIRAYHLINNKYPDFNLVLVGQGFEAESPNLSNIKKLVSSLNLNSKIIFLGEVKDYDLPGIYNLALVYVQPSLYEGFGLPVIEAMACGVPVVCANIGSLKEIAGDAVLYVDPKNAVEISNGIKRLLFNRQERKLFSVKGIEQAGKFSWEKTARQTIEVYRKIYS